MAYRELTEKQLKVIEMLVEGEKTIVDICKECDVPKRTFYDWRSKNKVFQEALSEAIDLKAEFMKQTLKGKFERYLKSLEDIATKGRNEAARVNALSKLIALAGLDPTIKQEITVQKNDETEDKNYLLELLKQKQNENGNDDGENEDKK